MDATLKNALSNPIQGDAELVSIYYNAAKAERERLLLGDEPFDEDLVHIPALRAVASGARNLEHAMMMERVDRLYRGVELLKEHLDVIWGFALNAGTAGITPSKAKSAILDATLNAFKLIKFIRDEKKAYDK